MFFEELNIPSPDYYLGVGSGSSCYHVGEMLKRAEKVFRRISPSMVIVFGDTNSTLAGALTATMLNIPVAHVEAGLRSFDKTMQEEINRVLVDHISDLLFCPTKSSVLNLRREGMESKIYLVGDVMFDLLKSKIKLIRKVSNDVMEKYALSKKEYVLFTVHRAENTDNPWRLRNILNAIIEISKNIKVVFPMHPRTRKMINRFGLNSFLVSPSIKVIKPVSYITFLALLKNAFKVFTDSGGVQKEAYILRIPCVTFRERTEWVETVMLGWNKLVGANKELIVSALWYEPEKHSYDERLFGDGRASVRIAQIIKSHI